MAIVRKKRIKNLPIELENLDSVIAPRAFGKRAAKRGTGMHEDNKL